MMQYKGYLARVEFEDEDDAFHGEVLGLRDVVTFEGKTVDDLRQAFRDSVDDYLEFCKEIGREPERPSSGKFVVRVGPELHRNISVLASLEGKSLNAWVCEQLQDAVVASRIADPVVQIIGRREHESARHADRRRKPCPT